MIGGDLSKLSMGERVVMRGIIACLRVLGFLFNKLEPDEEEFGRFRAELDLMEEELNGKS